MGDWQVRREWAPRHSWLARRWGAWRYKRNQKRSADGPDIADAGDAVDIGSLFGAPETFDDLLAGIVAIVAFLLFGALVWFFLLPLLLLAVDIVFVVLALVLGILGRVFMRRPWTVSADGPQGEHLEWRVKSWGRAGDVVQAVETALDAGMDPELSAVNAGAELTIKEPH